MARPIACQAWVQAVANESTALGSERSSRAAANLAHRSALSKAGSEEPREVRKEIERQSGWLSNQRSCFHFEQPRVQIQADRKRLVENSLKPQRCDGDRSNDRGSKQTGGMGDCRIGRSDRHPCHAKRTRSEKSPPASSRTSSRSVRQSAGCSGSVEKEHRLI